MGYDVDMNPNENNNTTTNKVLSSKKEKLLGLYDTLNDLGQNEAIKRVEELTEIDRYTNNEVTMAAHNDDNSKEQQELMMKDFEEMSKWED